MANVTIADLTPLGTNVPAAATFELESSGATKSATQLQIVQGLTITATVGGVLTIASGKTFTVSNTLTFTGTDASTVAFGAGGTVLYSGGALGTPSSGVGTNLTFGAVNMTGVASPTYAQGKLVYDTDNESLTFFNNETEVGIQIGQELWTRVRNSTGSTIANGAAVYVSGNHAGTGLPEVSLADADSAATTPCIGLATHSIENNSIGYVTTSGVVHGLNTSSFSNGNVLYLSSTPGVLTATAPTSPALRMRVGVVTRANATTGMITVLLGQRDQGFGTANQVLGMNAAATGEEYKTLSGTANEVTVTQGVGTVTLSIPSAVTFTSKTVTGGTFDGVVITGSAFGAGNTMGTPVSLTLTNATGLPTAGLLNSAVTLAKIQNAAANSKLLGSGASGSGAAYTEITVGSGLSMTGTTLSATGGGSGDVVGPAAATDNAIALFDSTTGKLLKNSAITVTGGNTLNAATANVTDVNATNVLFGGATVAVRPAVKITATNYTIGTTDPNELYGGVIYVTGAATITIPAVAAGASFTVITIGAVAVSVDPNAADLIYLDGTALSDGDKITNLSTAGDMAVFTYYDATGWGAQTNGWTDTN